MIPFRNSIRKRRGIRSAVKAGEGRPATGADTPVAPSFTSHDGSTSTAVYPSLISKSTEAGRDLWEKAYTNLKKSEPKLFAVYQSCIISSLAAPQESASTTDLDKLESRTRERFLPANIDERLRIVKQKQLTIHIEA
jgi:hypothetical protein